MRFLGLRPISGPVLALSLLLGGCSGTIAPGDPDDGAGAASGRRTGGASGTAIGGAGGAVAPPSVAGCPVRTGRPPWSLALHTKTQVRTIVGQVFGSPALEDDQLQSLLAGMPNDLKAKGFDTEKKDVSGQYTGAYVALVRRLATLAAEQAPVRTAIEAFAGKSCAGTTDLDAGCGLELGKSFASALARQPLADADWQPLLDAYKANKAKYQATNAYAGFIASVLLSARSTMRLDAAELDMTGAVDAHALGARLAMTLTSGLPDATLRAKMADGSIAKADVLAGEAKRLLRTPLGRATLAHFAEQWLNVKMLQPPPGRADYVPTLDDSVAVADAARAEIGKLFQSTAIDGGGTLADFYATDQVIPANGWLAKQYMTSTTDQPTRSPIAGRKGILTRVGFNLHGAFANQLPLAHRGLGVKVTMLCGTVAPVPDNIDKTLPPDAPDPMSSRQYFEILTEKGSCRGCHQSMNPYGYTMTGLSVTGQIISKETVLRRSNMQPADVDVSTKSTVKIDGHDVAVADASELSAAIGASRQGQACFADRFEQYAVGAAQDFLCDDEAAKAIDTPAKRTTIEDLIVAYVRSSAFAAR